MTASTPLDGMPAAPVAVTERVAPGCSLPDQPVPDVLSTRLAGASGTNSPAAAGVGSATAVAAVVAPAAAPTAVASPTTVTAIVTTARRRPRGCDGRAGASAGHGA